MTEADLKYLIEERMGIMLENGATEIAARQQARREVRDMVKEEMGVLRANMLALKLEKVGDESLL